ncbi:TPA: phage minor capsid protein [Streptococcus suis]|nr:phage minor capsid protein [Streptococcus suis]
MSDYKKRPTLNEQQFSLHMQAVSDIYAQMQIELFDSMIKRLKERGSADLVENPYIWQLEKLNDMHMLNEENLKIIAERTGIAVELLRQVIENEGLKVYQDTKQQLEEDLGQSASGTVRNGVTEALEAYTSQAVSDLNLINTTLPVSTQAVFKSIVEQTVAQVVSGTKTRDKAMNDTIMAWQKKGFTGFTDRAGREWRADAYARAVIKSTTYKVYNEMRTRPAEELGIDTFHYSIKSSARPSCSPLQNKIVTKSGQARTEKGVKVYALSDYGYGTAGGCLGIHCGHYLTPFIIGVNTIPDLPDYLKDLTPEQAEENARIEAKQRALERAIRHHKERLHYAKTLGDNELEMWEKLHIRNNQNKLRALVNEHDFLRRDYSRERFVPPNTGKVSGALNAYAKEIDKFKPLLPEEDKAKALYLQFAQRNAAYQAKHIQEAVPEFSYKDGLVVYNHIFRNKHNLYGKVKMFDPDVDMADSFARIFNGQKLLPHDIIMLKHERHEAQLMSQGLEYEVAHKMTEEIYNYDLAVRAYKKLKKGAKID